MQFLRRLVLHLSFTCHRQVQRNVRPKRVRTLVESPDGSGVLNLLNTPERTQETEFCLWSTTVEAVDEILNLSFSIKILHVHAVSYAIGFTLQVSLRAD
jgi:hypothetical protein